jgi:outer membrane protein assembly factor BamC
VQQARAPGAVEVLPQFPNVRLARAGQGRYVVVEAEPAAVWDEVREFLEETGLVVEQADPAAGLMETNWAENRAMVGGDSSFAKWFKSFFSTGVRDKYRVRLERGVVPGTTEIYIRHEGMEEVAPNEYAAVAQPGWRPRPRDRSLEAEMLQRLVAHLGGSAVREAAVAQTEAAPQAAPAQAPAAQPLPAPPGARLVRDDRGAPLLALEDSLERAWRRVGLSLDRIGFTVEERDRARGIYYVRYIDPESRQEPGFFSRLLGNEEPTPATQYRVHLIPDENGTRVEVQGEDGNPAPAKAGERILGLLYEQLK